MAEQSKLEQIALEQRKTLISKNTYNNAAPDENYSVKHTRALSDDITPINGKGTGIFLDTNNGGGSQDIYGNSTFVGSGRNALLASNKYNKDNEYKTPDTSKNNG